MDACSWLDEDGKLPDSLGMLTRLTALSISEEPWLTSGLPAGSIRDTLHLPSLKHLVVYSAQTGPISVRPLLESAQRLTALTLEGGLATSVRIHLQLYTFHDSLSQVAQLLPLYQIFSIKAAL